MKYERLTIKRENGFATVRNTTLQGLIDRLAELEDKIEAGELISTAQNEQREQDIMFFIKHDIEVCEAVVKECLQVLRDTRIPRIYDDYTWGWNKGIDQAIEQLTKKYCIDEEVTK